MDFCSIIIYLIFLFQKRRVLYVFAGQRAKEYLNDFFSYNVDTGQIEIIADGSMKEANSVGGTQSNPAPNPLNILCDELSANYHPALKEFIKKCGERKATAFWLVCLVFGVLR